MDAITPEHRIATIASEGRRIAAVDAESLAVPVPTLPDWNVERVVRHLGRVHRWVTGLLAASPDADPAAVSRAAAKLPTGPDCLRAYRDALDELLDALGATDPDRPVASFVGPADVGFWIRRQAHETAVHRVDAQDALHAAGGPPPDSLDPWAAVDGIAEWLQVFAAPPPRGRDTIDPRAAPPVTFAFVPTDLDESCRVRFDRTADGTGSVETDSTPGPADVVVSGPAGSLFLALWRRRSLDDLTITGDRDLVETLVDRVRI